MIENRPVLTFDTSVYNRMLRDGGRSNDVVTALRASYFMRIAGLSIEEVCATRDASKRKAIMEWVNKSQAGPGDYRKRGVFPSGFSVFCGTKMRTWNASKVQV